MVYSSGSAVRDDISGPGTWAFLPARLAGGETVVINAGFVQNTMQDRSQQDRAVSRLITSEPVTLTGYIRFPEAAGVLTPSENIAKRLWFTRDHLAMARALGWGEVAPFYIDLEAPLPASGIPKPGPLDDPSQGRSPAIRHHLVRLGGCVADRIRGLAAGAAAGAVNPEPVEDVRYFAGRRRYSACTPAKLRTAGDDLLAVFRTRAHHPERRRPAPCDA